MSALRKYGALWRWVIPVSSVSDSNKHGYVWKQKWDGAQSETKITTRITQIMPRFKGSSLQASISFFVLRLRFLPFPCYILFYCQEHIVLRRLRWTTNWDVGVCFPVMRPNMKPTSHPGSKAVSWRPQSNFCSTLLPFQAKWPSATHKRKLNIVSCIVSVIHEERAVSWIMCKCLAAFIHATCLSCVWFRYESYAMEPKS